MNIVHSEGATKAIVQIIVQKLTHLFGKFAQTLELRTYTVGTKLTEHTVHGEHACCHLVSSFGFRSNFSHFAALVSQSAISAGAINICHPLTRTHLAPEKPEP